MQFLILYYDELHNGGCKHYTSLIQSKIVTTKIQLQPKQNPIVTPQQEHNTTSTQPQHCSWVGLENDCGNPTPPTTETQL